jgi:uncharacterized protein YciI
MRFARFLIALALAAAAQEATSPYATSLYYVVFLRPDPARKPLTKEEGERIQNAHMANIHKMADDGLLAAAGPFENDPPAISGVFVMKAKSLEEARRVAGEDPTVKEHRNIIDVHAWQAPAGIGEEYFRLHKEHPETPENMGVQPLMILTRGPAWNDAEPVKLVSPLANHALYIERLHREGKLAAAGNVERDPDIIGIVVFRRIPVEEARRLIADDPAVKAGLVGVEAHRWWSSDHVLPW